MDKEKFLKSLSSLGFQLFEVDELGDVSLTLAEVVKNNDSRIWEGFPVVLSTAIEKNLFDINKTISCLSTTKNKGTFKELLFVALSLFKIFHVNFSWARNYFNSLSIKEKNEIIELIRKINKNMDIAVSESSISAERLKSIFSNYTLQSKVQLDEIVNRKSEAGFEYSLSQIFSPKQKELFLKKTKREKLTKTEKEYYSRVVKKKVVALANTELHQLSKKLLE